MHTPLAGNTKLSPAADKLSCPGGDVAIDGCQFANRRSALQMVGRVKTWPPLQAFCRPPRELQGYDYDGTLELMLQVEHGQPTRALVNTLLTMLVAADPLPLPASRARIRNLEALYLLIGLLDHCPVSMQGSVLASLAEIVAGHVRNQAACCKLGLLEYLLHRIPAIEEIADRYLMEKTLALVHVLGRYSVSVRELKTCLRLLRSSAGDTAELPVRPAYAPELLRLLRQMAPGSGPSVFFDLSGRQSGIALPPIDRWPNGWTFVTWLRVDTFRRGESDSYLPRLFSFTTASGVGVEAYFVPVTGNLTIQRIAAGGRVYPVQFATHLETHAWYHIAITHRYRRITTSELIVYVNGAALPTQSQRYPAFDDVITRCMIGTAPPGSEEDNASDDVALNGQLGAVYLFREALSETGIKAIYGLGPNYMSGFQVHDDVANIKVDDQASVVDLRLGKDLFLAYNPKACRGSMCYDSTPEAHPKLRRRGNATILPGTTVLRTHSLQDAVQGIGGVMVLFPLFAQLDHPLPNGRRDAAPLAPLLLGLVGDLVRNNQPNMHTLHAGEGFLVLSQLLQHASPNHLSVDVVHALRALMNDLASFKPLVSDLFKHIIFNFELWVLSTDIIPVSYTEAATQVELLRLMTAVVQRNPVYFRSVLGVQGVLDALRVFYWYTPEPHSLCRGTRYRTASLASATTPGARSSFTRPSFSDLRQLRTQLLSLLPHMVTGEGRCLTHDEIGAVLGHVHDCRDPQQATDVLQLLLAVLKKQPAAELIEHMVSADAISSLLNLLENSHELVRVLSLKTIGRLLALCPKPRQSRLLGDKTSLHVLSYKLAAWPFTEALYNALFELLTEQVSDHVLPYHTPLDGTQVFRHAPVIGAVFYLAVQAGESRFLPLLLADFHIMLASSEENRSFFLACEGWQGWLFSVMAMQANPSNSVVMDLVVQIFAVLWRHVLGSRDAQRFLSDANAFVELASETSGSIDLVRFNRLLYHALLGVVESDIRLEHIKDPGTAGEIARENLVVFVEAMTEWLVFYANSYTTSPLLRAATATPRDRSRTATSLVRRLTGMRARTGLDSSPRSGGVLPRAGSADTSPHTGSPVLTARGSPHILGSVSSSPATMFALSNVAAGSAGRGAVTPPMTSLRLPPSAVTPAEDVTASAAAASLSTGAGDSVVVEPGGDGASAADQQQQHQPQQQQHRDEGDYDDADDGVVARMMAIPRDSSGDWEDQDLAARLLRVLDSLVLTTDCEFSVKTGLLLIEDKDNDLLQVTVRLVSRILDQIDDPAAVAGLRSPQREMLDNLKAVLMLKSEGDATQGMACSMYLYSYLEERLSHEEDALRRKERVYADNVTRLRRVLARDHAKNVAGTDDRALVIAARLFQGIRDSRAAGDSVYRVVVPLLRVLLRTHRDLIAQHLVDDHGQSVLPADTPACLADRAPVDSILRLLDEPEWRQGIARLINLRDQAVATQDSEEAHALLERRGKAALTMRARLERVRDLELDSVRRSLDSVGAARERLLVREAVHRRGFAILYEHYTRTADVCWRRVLRNLTHDRGPFGTTALSARQDGMAAAHWKLDRSEDSLRRRRKLQPNYAYDPHDGAAVDYDQRRSSSNSMSSDAAAAAAGTLTGVPSDSSLRYVRASPLEEVLVDDDDGDNSEIDDMDSISGTSGEWTMLDGRAVSERHGASLALRMLMEKDEKHVWSCDCELVTPMIVVSGRLELTSLRLYFFVDRDSTTSLRAAAAGKMNAATSAVASDMSSTGGISTRSVASLRHSTGGAGGAAVLATDALTGDESKADRQWNLSQLVGLYHRRYLLRNNAFEFFLSDQTNYLVNFPSEPLRRRMIKHLVSLRRLDTRFVCDSRKPADRLRISDATDRWRRREISNFEYLMHLNTMAGRTYNDLTQYPVFPWVIADYTSPVLDLNNPATFRDLEKPIGALNPERLALFQERYASMLDMPEMPPFHYGTHYLSCGAVLYYMMRMEPFTTLLLQMQGGKFDMPDRAFFSVPQTWHNCLHSSADVKEVIPEFYYLPDIFVNANAFDFGCRSDGRAVNDVELPPWANGSASEFVRLNRQALESEYVSANLHHWIDLIFGHKQRGDAAVRAHNVFYYLTYEGAVDIDAIQDPLDRQATEVQINHFGQTPSQLLTTPHPTRMSVDEACAAAAGSTSGLASVGSSARAGTSAPLLASVLPPHTPGVFDGPISQARVADGPCVFLAAVPSRLVSVAGSGRVGVHAWNADACTATPDRHTSRKLGLNILRASCHTFAVSPSSNARYLYSCGHWDHSVKVTRLDAPGVVCQSVTHHKDVASCMAMCERGDVLATGGLDSIVHVWSVNDAAARAPLSGPRLLLWGHDDAVTAVAIRSDLDLVVSGARDGCVIVHTLRHGLYTYSFYMRTAEGQVASAACAVTHLVVSAEGTIVAAAAATSLTSSTSVSSLPSQPAPTSSSTLHPAQVRVTNVNGQCVGRFTLAPRDVLCGMAVSHDADWLILAIGGDAPRAEVRSIHSPDLVVSVMVWPDEVQPTSIAVAADDRSILIGNASGDVLALPMTQTTWRAQHDAWCTSNATATATVTVTATAAAADADLQVGQPESTAVRQLIEQVVDAAVLVSGSGPVHPSDVLIDVL